MTLLAQNLAKSFGHTRAVDDVSITLIPGAVHALVGENGAGKSTMLRMLAGAEKPDRGEMLLDGSLYAPPSSSEAAKRGVALVFQEVTINRSLTVAENIFIDRLRRFTGPLRLINRRRMNATAQSILDRLGVRISVASDLERLNLGEWKCIEIARALSMDPKILLLDESTAYLDHREVESVLGAMLKLKREGMTIAFVSHHLDEVRAIADQLTILKDGRHAGTFATGDIEPAEIHRRMVGRDLSQGIYPPRPAIAAIDAGAPIAFEAVELGVGQELSGATLEVRAGEILGLAGLKSAGADGLFAAISGDKPLTRGRMRFAGANYAPATPAAAWRAGVAHLPGDRTGEGLISDFSVLDNLVMVRPPRRGPFFNRRAAVATARDLIERIGIKTESVDATCRSLSGGNMQKVVIGKCLAPGPRLLLLNNPTRGVDVGARLEIYNIVRQMAAAGLAVILSSEDMPELLGLSDRLIVLRGGCIVHRFEKASAATEHEIVGYMT
jgi:ABC-type sugar transport system ATPase subunit